MFLEDIRPHTPGVSSDPQIELAFLHPTLSNGETPPGFLGYAVFVIFLSAEHLQFRTASGHGLPETLFIVCSISLNKSREHLSIASSCALDGAVSLDGGMVRGNGDVSVRSETHAHCSPLPLTAPVSLSSKSPVTRREGNRDTMQSESVEAFIRDSKKLEDGVKEIGLKIKHHEDNIEFLKAQKNRLDDSISDIQAYIGVDLGYDKDVVVEKIEGKADSAAAVILKLLRSPQSGQLYPKYAHDILGVVALLGEVRTHKLSRMLSTYLGEDEMLAVVCISRAAARALENYQMDGTVNCASSLDILAAKLGTSIKGQYLVICLEDIRPYKRGVGRDPQRELAFPHPTLSNGKTPPGFLGYAVNLIFPPAEHLQFRTASGHDLWETLFYRLLGKLQVYQSTVHLYMSSSCIEDGAVSLDGGMMRGNGVVSVSVGSEEPYILFPVNSLERQLPLSPDKVKRLKRMEDLKLELNQTQEQIQENIRSGEKYKKKLAKKLQYKKQIDDQLEPSPGMDNSDMDISGASG